MNEISEIKLPKGVDRISVTQHDDKVVIKFIPEGNEFKKGDFVYEDGRIMIVKRYPNSYCALIYPELNMKPIYNGGYALNNSLSSLSFRCATEDEKQLLIDAMKKDGKRWNADKKCIEDIPKRKFKEGDKVRIKDGISSNTHRNIPPFFTSPMDKFIGKKLTVKEYNSVEYVEFYEDDHGYSYNENWLEPWSDELKKGDLAIFWDCGDGDGATIRLYDKKGHEYHYDSYGAFWENAIKFESKEQFEKVLRGEID